MDDGVEATANIRKDDCIALFLQGFFILDTM